MRTRSRDAAMHTRGRGATGHEEEPEEMQSTGDQDEAVHKQPRAHGDKACPGLDHPGHNKKERPKQNDHKRRGKECRRPGLEHLRTSGGQMPRTGSSGVGKAVGTAAPRTEASGDQRPRMPPGLEHTGRNKQQAPRGASVVATRARPWRCSEAEWRTRPGRSGENKMRTRPM